MEIYVSILRMIRCRLDFKERDSHSDVVGKRGEKGQRTEAERTNGHTMHVLLLLYVGVAQQKKCN